MLASRVMFCMPWCDALSPCWQRCLCCMVSCSIAQDACIEQVLWPAWGLIQLPCPPQNITVCLGGGEPAVWNWLNWMKFMVPILNSHKTGPGCRQQNHTVTMPTSAHGSLMGCFLTFCHGHYFPHCPCILWLNETNWDLISPFLFWIMYLICWKKGV